MHGLGNYVRAIQYCRQSLEIALKLRSGGLENFDREMLIRFYLDWDHWDDALRMIDEWNDFALRTGGRYIVDLELFGTHARLATVVAELRDEPEQAMAITAKTAQAQSNLPSIRRPGILQQVKARLAALLITVGRFAEAKKALAEVESDELVPKVFGTRAWEPDVLRAELAAAEGDASAIELSMTAEARVSGWDQRNMARARRATGIALTRAGDFENAEKKLREALALFEQLDTRWQQGRTLVALGELSRARDDGASARDYFTRALPLFDAMEARYDAAKARGLIKELETRQ